MKTLLVLTTLLISQTSHAELLHCTGGEGGPTPAETVIDVRVDEFGKATIELLLVNSAVPEGISGAYSGERDQRSGHIYGIGNLDALVDLKSNVRLSPPNKKDGRRHLVIYAGHDRMVEFGFGAHFLCE